MPIIFPVDVCMFILPRGTKLEYFTTLIYCLVTMLLKSDLFYFVLVGKAYGFCLRARPVNSDHILNVLETVVSVLFTNTRTS